MTQEQITQRSKALVMKLLAEQVVSLGGVPGNRVPMADTEGQPGTFVLYDQPDRDGHSQLLWVYWTAAHTEETRPYDWELLVEQALKQAGLDFAGPEGLVTAIGQPYFLVGVPNAAIEEGT